jgi:hypothetical protein
LMCLLIMRWSSSRFHMGLLGRWLPNCIPTRGDRLRSRLSARAG